MIIRSSKHVLKYQTSSKTDMLEQLFKDYEQDLNFMIDHILTNNLIKSKFGYDIPSNIIKHSRWKQILYKHASEIVRSQVKLAERKRFKSYQKIYSKCLKSSKHSAFTCKRYKELILKPIERTKYFSKPDIKNLTITIDSRLIDSQITNYFDEFVQITLPYFQESKKRALKLRLPIKHHKHSIKFRKWNRKDSIRLRKERSKYFIEFIYENIEPDIKMGLSLGIDQGANKLISDSNGKHYGSSLLKLYKKINYKCKKVWNQNKFYKNISKNKQKLLIHRNNEINRIINEFFKENTNINQLVIEDLNDVKRYKYLGDKIKHWVYPNVIGKLERFCQENGIQLIKINPAYTSQTCSQCGVIDKASRVETELYRCKSCNLEIDADTNAAINILRRGVYNHPSPKP